MVEGNKMNINKQKQWKTGAFSRLLCLGRFLRMRYADYYLIRHGFCPLGKDSLPIVLQDPWIPFQHILICPLYPSTIFNGPLGNMLSFKSVLLFSLFLG